MQYENTTYGDIVILESWYWKKELAGLLAQINTWSPIPKAQSKSSDWLDERRFQLERSLFYTALVIRRLIDSRKVTDRLRGKSLQLNTLRSLKQFPHSILSILGSMAILDDFDFENPENEHFSPYKIASEILHSVTLEFFVTDSESDLESILVASEKNRFIRAIVIPKSVWIALLVDFINDEVTEFRVSLTSMEAEPEIKIK